MMSEEAAIREGGVERFLLIVSCFTIIGSSGGAAEAGVKSYQSRRPAFAISIPAAQDGWEIKTRDIEASPLAMFKTTTAGLPFISTSIAFRSTMPAEIQVIWNDPGKLFASKTAYDKQFEKQMLSDVEFLSDKNTTIAELPAFDRVYKSETAGATYHSVSVLFADAIVTFGLNAATTSFAVDDAEFLAILATLRPVTAASMGEPAQADPQDGIGVLAEKEDTITFDFARVSFVPPPGWAKQANVRHRTGVTFLLYTKDPANRRSARIGITRDVPKRSVLEAVDFTREVRGVVLGSMPG